MPSDKPQLDYLDYTSIRFPSDKLTIGMLRKVEPDKFDVQGTPDSDASGGTWEMVQELMRCERVLAHAAYEKAMGRDEVLGSDERGDFYEELMELYPRYGLAPGAVSAVELIKDVEAQAASQAQAYRTDQQLGRG